MLEAAAQRIAEARGEFVGALAMLAEQVIETAETAMGFEFVEACAAGEQYDTHVLHERAPELLDVAQDFIARAHHDFRSV